MTKPSGDHEWCFAIHIGPVGVNNFPLEEYFHHPRMPISGGISERCLPPFSGLSGWASFCCYEICIGEGRCSMKKDRKVKEETCVY